MSKMIVSVVRCLRLIPVSDIKRFARIRAGVIMEVAGDHVESAEAVPGSIKLTSDEDAGVITKTITYNRREEGLHLANLMETNKSTKLVAIYVDEVGNDRVCGSPDYPLQFSYTVGDGFFACKLEGSDADIDPFLIG